MQILSHRGLWNEKSEQNQRIAFERSFNAGLGTETDLRDCGGNIVIAHDMPKGDEITFETVLKIMNGRNLPLALNIKADGMCEQISALLQKYNHTNYFTFDMSIPDMVVQIKRGMRVFTGLSDILQMPPMIEAASGVWLDSYFEDWYSEDTIDSQVCKGKYVAIVSADLHKRDTLEQWKTIKRAKSVYSEKVLLCTDKSIKAMEYFNEKN